jgi:hypothetical protein
LHGNETILDYYRYAQLAAASYVRTGGSTNYREFIDAARDGEQNRLPLSLGSYLFNSANDYHVPVWNILSYYAGDNPQTPDNTGFAPTLFEKDGEKVLALRGASLGSTQDTRRETYRALLDAELDPVDEKVIRESIRNNWPTGSARFREQVDAMLRRTLMPGRRGCRPKVDFATESNGASGAIGER